MILKKIAFYEDFHLDYTASLKEAVAMMNSNGDGSVVLVKNSRAVAILTQSDIVNALEDSIDLTIDAYSVSSKVVLSVNENKPIDFAFIFLREKNIKRIVIVNDKEEFVGLVLQESLFEYMEENTYKIDLEVSHLLQNDRKIVTIERESSLHEILHLMKEKSVGSVIIVEDEKMVGIMTEKDVLKLIYQEVDLQNNIDEYISKPVISVNSETLVVNVISLLKRKNIRRILVTDLNGQPIDILSNHDILKYLKGKRQEKEFLLMQQSKLATMGEMIGHIAHQWRQPLAQLGGVFMNLDSAYEFDELNQGYLKDKVKNGNELIKYMSNTIQDFQDFFMPTSAKENFNIAECIDSANSIISATLVYHRVEVEIISPEESPSIFGNQSEFSQVILNLLNNAKDILIQRKIASPKIVIETEVNSQNIILRVRDNAQGVDEDIINSIFDIYFTTKSKNEGSGLGLYISKLIIENKFAGTIEVLNREDGAEFKITLNRPKISQ